MWHIGLECRSVVVEELTFTIALLPVFEVRTLLPVLVGVHERLCWTGQ